MKLVVPMFPEGDRIGSGSESKLPDSACVVYEGVFQSRSGKQGLGGRIVGFISAVSVVVSAKAVIATRVAS